MILSNSRDCAACLTRNGFIRERVRVQTGLDRRGSQHLCEMVTSFNNRPDAKQEVTNTGVSPYHISALKPERLEISRGVQEKLEHLSSAGRNRSWRRWPLNRAADAVSAASELFTAEQQLRLMAASCRSR